jgi:hypothetical protein
VRWRRKEPPNRSPPCGRSRFTARRHLPCASREPRSLTGEGSWEGRTPDPLLVLREKQREEIGGVRRGESSDGGSSRETRPQDKGRLPSGLRSRTFPGGSRPPNPETPGRLMTRPREAPRTRAARRAASHLRGALTLAGSAGCCCRLHRGTACHPGRARPRTRARLPPAQTYTQAANTRLSASSSHLPSAPHFCRPRRQGRHVAGSENGTRKVNRSRRSPPTPRLGHKNLLGRTGFYNPVRHMSSEDEAVNRDGSSEAHTPARTRTPPPAVCCWSPSPPPAAEPPANREVRACATLRHHVRRPFSTCVRAGSQA